jgi:hypothetical protein
MLLAAKPSGVSHPGGVVDAGANGILLRSSNEALSVEKGCSQIAGDRRPRVNLNCKPEGSIVAVPVERWRDVCCNAQGGVP